MVPLVDLIENRRLILRTLGCAIIASALLLTLWTGSGMAGLAGLAAASEPADQLELSAALADLHEQLDHFEERFGRHRAESGYWGFTAERVTERDELYLVVNYSSPAGRPDASHETLWPPASFTPE